MANVTLDRVGIDNYRIRLNGIPVGWYLRKRPGPNQPFALINHFNDAVLGTYETYIEATKAVIKFFK